MMPAALRALWRHDRARMLVILALLAMVAINQLGTGLLFSLIPVKLAADGYPASAAGIISTTFSVGFIVGCLTAARIIGSVGPERMLIGLGVFNAAMALLHWALPGPYSWALFRGIGGVTTASYFVLVESWLASQTTAETRGIVFGLYMVMNRLAFALGQIVLAYVDASRLLSLFWVAAAAYLLAPFARPRLMSSAPPMTRPSLANFFELPRLAPAAAAGALMHGLIFGSAPGLIPKWGAQLGISIDRVAIALALVQLGGLLVQLPVSYASDHIERRTIMAAAAFSTTMLSLLLLWMSPASGIIWFAAILLWGGVSATLYSLAAAHANDLAQPEQRVAWVSSLMLLWATGAAVGPLVASLLMDSYGVNQLWTYAASVSGAIGLFLVWRKVIRPS
jgi:MFS family permease